MMFTPESTGLESKLINGSGIIGEYEANTLLSSSGIPMVTCRRAATPEEAVRIAAEVGFPVVLKGSGPEIAHKSDLGLVKTGLFSPEAVSEAAVGMIRDGEGIVDSFLVQPMIRGRREFVAGMFRDPQFGTVIMFGLGGVYTEALNDTVFRLAPLTERDMDDMLTELVSAKLLGPFRGEMAVDLKTLKNILRTLSDLACAYPRIREIDINPLIITADGSPVAVDGLIITGDTGARDSVTPRIDLKALGACFYPSSIAFVGASATPGKWGHLLSSNTLSRNYKGEVYLVNPKGGTIMGRTVYPSVADVPGKIDLAVVTIPSHRVMDLIPELEKQQVRGMLLITSGFREIGSEGAALEQEVVAAAKDAGILVFGPNTMGMCNPHADLYCTAAHAYPIPGSTALVCQSGNMGTQLLGFAEQQGIGIRAFSGSGNEAMVTIEDYMEAFEVDDLTRNVVLYIESVKDGKRFFESARRVSKQKPIVVLKGGRTALGEKAAASHTGAMASDGRIFDATCRQAGIIQVDQPMELLDLSSVFSSLPLPAGNRVGIMTLGGGWGVVATDLCIEHGLEVPALSDDIINRLNGILPAYWSHANPVDLVGEIDPEIPRTCLEELLKWDGCDAVIHLGIHGKRILVANMIESVLRTDPAFTREKGEAYKKMLVNMEEDYIRYVAELTVKYQKPVLGVSLMTDSISRTLYGYDDLDFKSVFFPSPERAVKALSGMCRYETWRKDHS